MAVQYNSVHFSLMILLLCAKANDKKNWLWQVTRSSQKFRTVCDKMQQCTCCLFVISADHHFSFNIGGQATLTEEVKYRNASLSDCMRYSYVCGLKTLHFVPS